MPPKSEHRLCHRTHLNRPVVAEYHTYRVPLQDLSLTGGFIEDDLPVHVGQSFPLTLWLSDSERIEVEAEVRRALPRKGVGIEFVTISHPDSVRLREFLKAAQRSAV